MRPNLVLKGCRDNSTFSLTGGITNLYSITNVKITNVNVKTYLSHTTYRIVLISLFWIQEKLEKLLKKVFLCELHSWKILSPKLTFFERDILSYKLKSNSLVIRTVDHQSNGREFEFTSGFTFDSAYHIFGID